jgi:hypothetical protein
MKRLSLIVMLVVFLASAAMSQEIKSFCEYGTAVALRLGAGGALWSQNWGEDAWPWHECDAMPDVGFLNRNSVGLLETTTAGPPVIDADLILRFSFGGTITLMSRQHNGAGKVAGTLTGDVAGTFVADLNPARAVVDDEAGTITIIFGVPLHDEPDALITITETTGKYQSIHPVGPWEWYVSGTIQILRVPEWDVQTNIMAALLPQSPLLLGAQEEIVLTGSYYRGTKNDQ